MGLEGSSSIGIKGLVTRNGIPEGGPISDVVGGPKLGVIFTEGIKIS